MNRKHVARAVTLTAICLLPIRCGATLGSNSTRTQPGNCTAATQGVQPDSANSAGPEGGTQAQLNCSANLTAPKTTAPSSSRDYRTTAPTQPPVLGTTAPVASTGPTLVPQTTAPTSLPGTTAPSTTAPSNITLGTTAPSTIAPRTTGPGTIAPRTTAPSLLPQTTAPVSAR